MEENCELLTLQHILGKKWTLPLLFELRDAQLTFNELKERTNGQINSTLLSQTLKAVESHGMLVREEKERVFYSLTRKGQELVTIFKSFKEWAVRNEMDVGKDCAQNSCLSCSLFEGCVGPLKKR